MIPNSKFHIVAIAGTFDRLHKGHWFFIAEAFKRGEKVLIGLTSDEYVEKKLRTKNLELRTEGVKGTPGVTRRDSPGVEESRKASLNIKILNFQIRRKELERFLREERLLDRAQIVKIDDVYGPAIRRAGQRKNEIEALVVTEETYEGGLTVNRRREELGLSPLKLLKLPMILAQDNKRIASTRIRWGEIDRWGKVFVSRITYHVSRINEELRQELKKPLGRLIKGDPRNLNYAAGELKEIIRITQPVMIITVGDEVTKACNETGIAINLAIFDYKVGRKTKYHSLGELGFRSAFARGTLANGLVTVKNPAGYVTRELVEAVNNAYQKLIKTGRQQMIEVIGEEDLAGVPAVLLAPLGSIVLYGQPQEGVVVVEVTEEMKEKLLLLMKKYL